MLPLSRGDDRAGDEPLDPGPPASEFLLGPPVVRGHLSEDVLAGPLVVDPSHVVFPSDGPTGVALVMPEVEVPMPSDLPDACPAPDLHRCYL